MNIICKWLGYIARVFIYQPELAYLDEFGDKFVTAEPESFYSARDPYSVSIIEEVEFNIFGLQKRTGKYISWYGKVPDYLTRIKSGK